MGRERGLPRTRKKPQREPGFFPHYPSEIRARGRVATTSLGVFALLHRAEVKGGVHACGHLWAEAYRRVFLWVVSRSHRNSPGLVTSRRILS
jgi:hypothetical protein